jgi:5-methylthioadenosine/S-adenosylhomocysteine deaminase
MFEEMDLAAKLQKLVTMDPQVLPARAVIDMATIEGAKVLGLDKITGSLEPGKRADLITISLDEANATPLYNIESQLVYAIKGSDVRDVMINGKWIVRNRNVLTLNAAAIKQKAAQYQIQVAASLKQ